MKRKQFESMIRRQMGIPNEISVVDYFKFLQRLITSNQYKDHEEKIHESNKLIKQRKKILGIF